MKEEENIGIVKQLYDAFKRRDISSLLDMFTDDAILHDLPPQVCSLGEVFTKVVEELQNSSQPLASPLNSNSLSCRTLLSKATRLQCLDTKRGKPSLQADHMRLSLYIYGMY